MISNISEILGLLISTSAVLGIFSAIINKLFDKKLKPLEEKIDKHKQEAVEEKMTELRYQIVSFASSLRKGEEKTIYEFSAIFKFIDDYDKDVKRLGINNNLFEEERLFIKEQYRKINKDTN